MKPDKCTLPYPGLVIHSSVDLLVYSCQWYFQKINLPEEEAHLLWEPTRPQIIQALADDSRRLQNDLYKWKISNLERVESIKKQVEIFMEHIDEVKRGQQDLF